MKKAPKGTKARSVVTCTIERHADGAVTLVLNATPEAMRSFGLGSLLPAVAGSTSNKRGKGPSLSVSVTRPPAAPEKASSRKRQGGIFPPRPKK
jgi:hypothetical protein